jgi:3-dehydroquinate dehydratase II
MQTILILNGPNLNMLGTREPEVYGTEPFEKTLADIQRRFMDLTVKYFQSNHEGALLDKLQAVKEFDSCVFNPGAYSHTSYALYDCIRMIDRPVVEVHISNIHAREAWRQHSLISPVCKGVISGLGTAGYTFAIDWLLHHYKKQ